MKRKRVKFWNGFELSPLTVNTVLGVSGMGALPFMVNPLYLLLLAVIRATKTTVHAKSSTYEKWIGCVRNSRPWTYWQYIKKIENDGLVNCFGHTNPGIDRCAELNSFATMLGNIVIPNYYADFTKGFETAVRQSLEALGIYTRHLGENFKAFELSAYCPNFKENIDKNIINIVGLLNYLVPRLHSVGAIVIIKLSLEHPFELAQEAKKIGVDALHAINAGSWDLIFPRQTSPLKHVGGGAVSGRPLFPDGYHYNYGLRKAVGDDMIIIMGGGAAERCLINFFFDIGASAVTCCTRGRLDKWGLIQDILHYNSP